jgi:SAM-dependent methyltransferase
MSDAPERPSSHPSFWDERYVENDALFGTRPSAFVVQEADRIPEGGAALELGAGEGRTLLWLARERGCTCTAVDFAETALDTAHRRAREEGLSLDTVTADVRRWTPDRQWDGVIVTFLQLLPEERRSLYHTIRSAVRNGGIVLGEWFRPAHLEGDYDRLGPSSPDRMVSPTELRDAFAADEIHACRAEDVTLAEGPILRGNAAVVRLVAQRAPR